MLASDTLMKLIRQRERFDNGGHLFAIASRVMMRLLIDYHRTRKAAKRGSGQPRPRVARPRPAGIATAGDGLDVEALNAALEKLAALDARKADVVKYRVLWGLTTAEIAQTAGRLRRHRSNATGRSPRRGWRRSCAADTAEAATVMRFHVPNRVQARC